MGSIKTVTNEYGSLEDRCGYDAFGKPYDTVTGMYNYGYRDYKPDAARFTTVALVRDGANWFVYVNNDPVNYIDPWGLIPFVASSMLDGGGGNNTPILGEPVYAIRGGTVTRSGWQDPDDHSIGNGYRTTIDTHDGYFDNYGHLQPGSASPPGTKVEAGDYIGRMADPTNGDSTGPHVHVERRENKTGAAMDHGTASPFAGPSRITSGFQSPAETGVRDHPHSGVDHVPGKED
jgi:RHS repeat-associated protein